MKKPAKKPLTPEPPAAPQPAAEPRERKPPKSPPYIVGMGGSAGALEAFEEFFGNMPNDSGLAFILVPHLDPTHKGIMPELLQRITQMKVMQAEDGMHVRPNSVYVIPSNRDKKGQAAVKAPKEIQASIPEAAQKLLLENYSPPAVLVNSSGDIIYISGRTGKYLELSTGKAAMNVFALARQGLGIELASAVRKAHSLKEEVVHQGLQVKVNGGLHLVDLVVKPVHEPEFMRGLLLVIFRDAPAIKPAGRGKKTTAAGRDPVIEEMQKEMNRLRESLQTTTEEMETSQEELKSANEELQSTNEELQSSNEELTTSKEELQSLNEELITVNSELQMKIEELTQSNNDMRNLLNSTEIATIFLDNEMNVKRFTSQANRIFNLIQSDVGRPLTHIVSNLRYENLTKDVNEVLETLVYKEVQVQSTDERWYSMRIMPYRTVENIIDGAVLTLVDISPLKQLEVELRQMSDICESSSEAIIGRTLDGIIFSWNKGAERMYGYTAEEAKRKPIDFIVPPEGRDEMAGILDKVKRGEHIEQHETVRQRKDGTLIRVSLTVSPIRNVSGKITGASTIAREIREE